MARASDGCNSVNRQNIFDFIRAVGSRDFVLHRVVVRIREKNNGRNTKLFCGEQQLSDSHQDRACGTRRAAESEGVRKNYDENDNFRVDGPLIQPPGENCPKLGKLL